MAVTLSTAGHGGGSRSRTVGLGFQFVGAVLKRIQLALQAGYLASKSILHGVVSGLGFAAAVGCRLCGSLSYAYNHVVALSGVVARDEAALGKAFLLNQLRLHTVGARLCRGKVGCVGGLAAAVRLYVNGDVSLTDAGEVLLHAAEQTVVGGTVAVHTKTEDVVVGVELKLIGAVFHRAEHSRLNGRISLSRLDASSGCAQRAESEDCDFTFHSLFFILYIGVFVCYLGKVHTTYYKAPAHSRMKINENKERDSESVQVLVLTQSIRAVRPVKIWQPGLLSAAGFVPCFRCGKEKC